MIQESEDEKNVKNLLELVKKKGMTNELYRSIAMLFTSKIVNCDPKIALELLVYFIKYNKERLYVNEIKNYLKNHSKELFKAYGKKFEDVCGCKEVFGFESENSQRYVLEESVEEEESENKQSLKDYSKKRRKRATKRVQKAEAKKLAIQKFHYKIEKKAEKRKRREEFEALLRKENGS